MGGENIEKNNINYNYIDSFERMQRSSNSKQYNKRKNSIEYEKNKR